jgi:hypothetical protein
MGLAIDNNVPLAVVKSLVGTAALAGFTDSMLYVRNQFQPSHIGALHIYGVHPAFQRHTDLDSERILSIAIQSKDQVSIAWFEGDTRIYGAESITTVNLANFLRVSFQAFGKYKTEDDKGVNWVILDALEATPMREVIPVLDAIQAPRRRTRMHDGSIREIEAFDTILALDEQEIAYLKRTSEDAKIQANTIARALEDGSRSRTDRK